MIDGSPIPTGKMCTKCGDRGDLERHHVTFKIVIEKDGDGLHGYIPKLKGLHTDGDTIEGVLKNVGGSLSLYMESMIKHNDKIRNVGEVMEDKMKKHQFPVPVRSKGLKDYKPGPMFMKPVQPKYLGDGEGPLSMIPRLQDILRIR